MEKGGEAAPAAGAAPAAEGGGGHGHAHDGEPCHGHGGQESHGHGHGAEPHGQEEESPILSKAEFRAIMNKFSAVSDGSFTVYPCAIGRLYLYTRASTPLSSSSHASRPHPLMPCALCLYFALLYTYIIRC